MTKTFVTGGAGFLGSHLVDKLIKEGHQVIVVDNLSSGKKENLNPGAKFYQVDIRDSKISQIFEKEKPETVFHYAAQVDVKKSVENPVENADINILGTLNVLENCKKFGVKKFIFASSVGIYGEPKKLPVSEDHPLNPLAPYPITKLAIEEFLNHYQAQGLDFVCLRYSNIYGPRQSSEGEGGVVAIFTNKILKEERPFIFGSGNQTRDFLYVDDAINAALLSLKAPVGSTYNVGTNREISILGLSRLLSSKLNKELQPIFKPPNQREIVNSRIDFSKIKRELNWQPKYDLEKGLEETMKYYNSIGTY